MKPRVAILSAFPELYSTRRLLEAGRALGHDVTLLNPYALSLQSTPDGPALWSRGQPIPRPDIVLPRMGSALLDWNLLALESLLAAGARSPQTPQSLALAADKGLSALRLSRAGLATVPTWIVRETEELRHVLEQQGPPPWILKLPHGTQGRSVVRVENLTEATRQCNPWFESGRHVLVQPWIPTTPCRDLRVLVVEGRAIAASWRVAAPGEFRSNLHQGGHAEAAPLCDAARTLAQAAAATLGLTIAGVDLIEAAPPGGPRFLILEVNGCPGLKSIEQPTGVNAARAIMEATLHA